MMDWAAGTLARMPVCIAKASEFLKSSFLGMDPIAGRKVPVNCGEYKDVTNTTPTVHTEKLERSPSKLLMA